MKKSIKQLGLVFSIVLSLTLLSFTFDSSSNNSNLRVTIYEGKSFQSYNSTLWSSMSDLRDCSKNDELSSVQVEKGTVARFYKDKNYNGCYFEIVGPYSITHLEKYYCNCCNGNGHDWDNEISSIYLYPDNNYKPGIYGTSLKHVNKKNNNDWDPGGNK